jgi:sulfur-carrier protein
MHEPKPPDMAIVRIPTPFRSFTQNQAEVAAAGGTVGEVLSDLAARHPGMSERLFDEGGQLRRYVNVFANEEDIRALRGLATPVSEGDRLTLLPAIAGG